MNNVNTRFIEVLGYLQANNFVSSKAEFLRQIDISSSMFTEISKGRSNVGLKVIQNTVLAYPSINLQWWITGVGDMILDSSDDAVQNKAYTPPTSSSVNVVSEAENASILHPKKDKLLHPTLHPNVNLGLPKVVTVNESNDDLVTLVSAKAAAGYLNGYADPEYIEHLPTIKLPNLKGGTHRAFEIKGHSMNPTIHNGAIAVGRWEESLLHLKENYVYIVVTKTDGIVCKRVLNRVEESGKLILKSDNNNKKEYPNIILDVENVVEVWRLRGGFIFEFPEPNEVNHRINDLEATVTLIQDQLRKMIP